MSRRAIFLIAAGIITLYFSIIAIMLSPLHVARGSYFGNNYLGQFGFRPVPAVSWCRELGWRPRSSPVTALASFPGSGNTWLRYLLQQTTGILTGSIYMDYGLRVHGFPGENITDGRVLVVKTHEKPPLEPDKFHTAVLLIRNPRDAILADFNRLHKGHIGTAPRSAFQKFSNKHMITEWEEYVNNQLQAWENLHRAWLTQYRGRLHLVDYDLLVQNTEEVLSGVLEFLNIPVSATDLNCAMKRKEGIYRRKRKDKNFDPFTASMYKDIENVRSRILGLTELYRKKQNVTSKIDSEKSY